MGKQQRGKKPSKAALGKRKVPPAQDNGKGEPNGELGPTGKPKRRPDQPKKVKLRDQKFMPVPATSFEAQNGEDSEDDFNDEDLGVDEGLDAETAGAFLKGFDRTGLTRSIKETQRLHLLSKEREQMPKQKRTRERLGTPESLSDYDVNFDSDDAFPSDLASDEEMGRGSGSGSEEEKTDDDDEDLELSEDDDQSALNDAFDDTSSDQEEEEAHQRKRKRAEGEADYETMGRARWAKSPSKEAEDSVEVGRLPIKLPSGEIQTVAGSTRIALPSSKKKKAPLPESEDEVEEDEDDSASDDGQLAERMAGQTGKFGRMGVAEIVGAKGMRNAERLAVAKEQIAQIGAEILAGGELIDIGPVLTRLSTFGLATVPSLEEGQGQLPVPNSIRGLAFLSQLAVYKDLIPGYRVRQLTAAEEAEKVRDEVRRMREGEKLLVRSYKGYLKSLEAEIKKRTPLASLCIKCMADLLSSAPHFNFSENIMGVLVGRVARKTWDEDCETVLQSFVTVFKRDVSAIHSQTLVRLIARMIKERKFQVHPNVLGSFMHLRLRTELDSMRSGKNARGPKSKGKRDDNDSKKFKSDVRKKWQTKNQRKREKEMKQVRKEQAEAEAEVDVEERAQVQTETLKNLFVLYFSILKYPGRSPLLPTALEGITQFAHHINVDFFRDLLAVLRRIIFEQAEPITRGGGEEDGEADDALVDTVGASTRVRTRLLAIVTAFELLSGQGEAINIDLGDFVNALFALLRPLSLDTGIEDPPIVTTSTMPSAIVRPLQIGRAPPKTPVQLESTSALLFRCLHAIFFVRNASAATAPPWRAAAFSKRLSECALFFPPSTAAQAVQFVRQLFAKEVRLSAMLDTEERTFDGVYKAEMDDPQLCNPFATSLWELEDLAKKHWDNQVRTQALALRDNKVA